MSDRAGDSEMLHRPPGRAAVTVAVLGPTAVTVDGSERRIRAGRERAVLACLSQHPSEALSADRLLEEIWGDDLPETGARAVAYQIAKLRSSLEPDRTGEGTLISTSGAGYTLHVGSDDVDAHRFEHLIDEARALLGSEPAQAEASILEAMALWRGSPFADLDDEPFVERRSRQLREQHVVARRTLAEARIALGRAQEVVGELESLVDDHPLDESLVGVLMTALHESGRTADALRAYGALRRRLAEELGIEPSHTLRNLERRVLTAGDQPPAPTHSPRPTAIPAPLTSFVGRQEELVELQEWLTSARLVTLCGFGGLGKTRLAQEIARRVDDRFRDGVWYVDLAPVADAAMLADAIIGAGGFTRSPARDHVDHLLSLLVDRQSLLVLDNCEHLRREVAALVSRVLHTAPHVSVLATSRVSLGVVDEAVWSVGPLPPEPAAELFEQRADLARASFTIDDANRRDVERLVRKLDGIPLAIELAAARLAVMGVQQLAEHLDDRFDVLTGGGDGVEDRQRSLATVIGWSYDLLDEPSRAMLRRMSLCVDGFDLDAATRIGMVDPSATLAEVLDQLSNLVEASLVRFHEVDGTQRYRMLEPVRQWADARFDPEERHQAAHAHACHFASVATTMFDRFSTSDAEAVDIGSRELGNLRAAMSWAYRNGHGPLGLSIARNVRMFFHGQQLDRELLGWLSTGLDLVDDDEPGTLEAAAGACHAAANIHDTEQLARSAARVERGIDSVGAPSLHAELLSAMCSKHAAVDPRVAVDYVNRALELRASEPVRDLALLFNRIDLSFHGGGLDDGDAITERLAPHRRRRGPDDPYVHLVDAGIAAWAGRWDEVVDTAAAISTEVMVDARLRMLRAEGLAALGRHGEALETISQLDADALGYYFHFAVLVRASIDLRRGEPDGAVHRLDSVIAAIERDGRRLALGAQVAALLAVAARDLGEDEAAAVLFGHADAELRRLGIALRASQRPLVEEGRQSCRDALGTTRFDELAARGATTEWCDLPRVEP